MDEKLFTIKEIEKKLRVKRQAVAAWIKSGKLPAFKAGKYWRIKENDLNNFINGNRKHKLEK